jgi:5-methylcytosine-specific restriction protein B
MSASDDLATLYDQMVAEYAGGISNTSTAKFDEIRGLFSKLFVLGDDDVYCVGAGTRTTNLPIRFTQGRQATQKTPLGVGFVAVPEGKSASSVTESATTTLCNYADRGRGRSLYDGILIVAIVDGRPQVTRLIEYGPSGLPVALKAHFPKADVVDATTSINVGAPKALSGEDAIADFAELFVEGSERRAGLRFPMPLAMRFLASLLSKRFVILTGLSGSGKTKIATALARWLTRDPGFVDPMNPQWGKHPNPNYVLVPVGADWNGNENIIGYPDGLRSDKYVTKPALELMRRASMPEFSNEPHFLILDEMNLSHVERYFSDLLSMIESGESITLYADERDSAGVVVDTRSFPPTLRLPPNVYIIGTVNVDETTYMFSPKVLDRANVIELRVEPDDMAGFLRSPATPSPENLDGIGADFGSPLVSLSQGPVPTLNGDFKKRFDSEMTLFFEALRDHGAEFGYRVALESTRLVHFLRTLGDGKCWIDGEGDAATGHWSDADEGQRDWLDHALDAVVVQKMLPKLHGSKAKMGRLLKQLFNLAASPHAGETRTLAGLRDLGEPTFAHPEGFPRYPLTADKVVRMWRHLEANGFTSFPEN